MMTANRAAETFEISPRFRQTVEARISRLEQDADRDEAYLANLFEPDHIRRHMRLIALERAEAERMRRFLDRCHPRPSNSPIAL